MKVAVIGASGLIGGHIVEVLESQALVSEIVLLVRKKMAIASQKVKLVEVDFSLPTSLDRALEGVDAVFCSVGTTRAKVNGDMDAYRKVDFDIPVNVAKSASVQGCDQLLLVSSVGADARSSNFYLKLKGEVETAVLAMGIPSISIFRPSMLLGHRSEFRLGERIGQAVMKTLSFLIPSKYKPIEAHDVARAMVLQAVTRHDSGQWVLEYKEMRALLKS